MKHEYIQRVFTDWDRLKDEGIYFSGIKGEGKYKEWWPNGQLFKHLYYKNGNKEGEYKQWQRNGELKIHRLYKKNEIIKDYLT